MSGQRPYATLYAKGEDRRQRILAVAQRLLTSKEQLLHAVLEARDAYDHSHRDESSDILQQLEHVAERFRRAPHLIGMFVVLLVENLDPEAPLRQRLVDRYRLAVEILAARIRDGQRTGRYRTDLDPSVKAAEIVAFLYGMEASWLVDPSLPVAEVFKEYIQSLALQLTSPEGAR